MATSSLDDMVWVGPYVYDASGVMVAFGVGFTVGGFTVGLYYSPEPKDSIKGQVVVLDV